MRRLGLTVTSFVAALAASGPAAANEGYIHFESGPVRPIALSPSGRQLFVTNTSDNRLEVFDVLPDGALRYRGAVVVGLEPVTVAARTDDEVWVVNHLSDSVSIVDVSGNLPRVTRTLLVGDEPRDLVFAGTGRRRAFVTTARRGQNSPVDPAFTTPGVGRALVWVFDALDLGREPGGRPLKILTLFSDTPRGLAASPDGTLVYAAAFHSGNQTVPLSEKLVTPVVDGLRSVAPNIELGPATNVDGVPAPPTGRMVRWNRVTAEFEDENGIPWTPFVPFRLPDRDVFEIDAAAAQPRVLRSFSGVGTILFNLAVDPVSGHVFVGNGEANNMTRFEGPGITGGSTVRGHLHAYRVTTIDPRAGAVNPVHLNPHLDYDLSPAATAAAGVAERSLATPLDLVFARDGALVYIAAFGSNVVAALDPEMLLSGQMIPRSEDHIAISGGGPAGLALHDDLELLYVYTRYDNAVSVVDVAAGREIDVVPLSHSPEPEFVRAGRPLLYDARRTSANGEASCSSCHVFAKTDDLSWDLGNPDAAVAPNNNVQLSVTIEELKRTVSGDFFFEHHPMKGPLLTQNLRGMANHGPMHWRGDRSGGSRRDDPASLDEKAAFLTFNPAFVDLLGRTTEVVDSEMEAFADFVLSIPYPPSPVRRLDGALRPDEARGRVLFEEVPTSALTAEGQPTLTCETCHLRDVDQGFFGSSGRTTFDALPQMFKIPHLRALYERVGMFGRFAPPDHRVDVGDQIRSHGFSHDGFTSNLFTFLTDVSEGGVFAFPGDAAERNRARRDLEAFLLAFDSSLAPAVGQQVTVSPGDAARALLPHVTESAAERAQLLASLAEPSAGGQRDCDRIIRGQLNGRPRGWLQLDDGTFLADDGQSTTLAAIEAAAEREAAPLTHTCVYPGGGRRLALDRNDDGVLDGQNCGDVDADGVITRWDAERLLGDLHAGRQPAFPERCNVVDGSGEPEGTCTLVDAVALARQARGIATASGARCAAVAR
jgi:YVTN family beta-propeller protein